jgi:hypothetical protein
MQISSPNAIQYSAADSPEASNAPTSSTTGFWALFANSNFPEPSWSGAATAPAAIPSSTQFAPGSTGFEAPFGNPEFLISQNLMQQGDLYDSSTL